MAAPVGGQRNPRLGPAVGDRLLYPAYQVLHRAGGVATVRGPHGTRITFDPERFTTARFERAGVYGGGVLRHAYGAGDGWFEWRFKTPAAITHLRFRARLSSEYPGDRAPPDGASTVTVRVDGQTIGRVTAPPDDGRGAVVSLAARRRLSPGLHTLRLEVAEDAHGLCVYGEPGAHADEGVIPTPPTLTIAR
jgi:hypothetical protein